MLRFLYDDVEPYYFNYLGILFVHKFNCIYSKKDGFND